MRQFKAADIVGDIVGARAANTESMTEDQGLHPVIRESLITLNILVRLLLLKLIAFKPLEVAEFVQLIFDGDKQVIRSVMRDA